MPEVYDNWERLVETILKREELRRLALCPSFSSCTSDDDSSCPSLIDSPLVNLTSGAGVGKRGFAAKAATLFAAPAILRTLFLRSKPKLQHHVSHASGELRRFSFGELLIATDSFNNKNFLGSGRFGDVYKGQLEDGSLVAVKRCKRKPTQQEDGEFQAELEITCKVTHRNLRRLHGFCATTGERLLVYPLMVNRSVASWLRERSATQLPLDWSPRKRIALGSARGLEILHQCDPIVIHCDVKVANILLDEYFEAVLCDFGMAMLMDRNDTRVITSTLFGTSGHMPPEYHSIGQVSEKTDVFSYGVMLLELLSGQRAFDIANDDDDVMLLDWVWKLVKENKLETLIDPDLKNNYIKAGEEQLLQLALICTQRSPVKRPEMREVVKMLQGDGGLAERWEELQNDEMFRCRMK